VIDATLNLYLRMRPGRVGAGYLAAASL
jgi:hypothetical protein